MLIDEVEEGLHHSALAGVWRSLVTAAAVSGTQLVVSTHSEGAIAAAVEAMEGRVEDLTLVRLRGAARDEQPGGSDHTSPIEAVTYRGRAVSAARKTCTCRWWILDARRRRRPTSTPSWLPVSTDRADAAGCSRPCSPPCRGSPRRPGDGLRPGRLHDRSPLAPLQDFASALRSPPTTPVADDG